MLRRIKIICCSSILVCASAFVYADDASNFNQRTVTASGHAEIKIPQTIATMVFTLSNNDDDAKSAQLGVRKDADILLTKLNALHPLELHTNSITVFPVMSYKDGVSKINGYNASYSIEVKTNIADAGKFIDTAIANNVTMMNAPQLSASDDERNKAQLSAIRQATLRAKAQASVSLNALGLKEQSIKQIIIAPNNGQLPVPRTNLMRASGANAAMAAPTTVEAGDDIVSADVSVVVAY